MCPFKPGDLIEYLGTDNNSCLKGATGIVYGPKTANPNCYVY